MIVQNCANVSCLERGHTEVMPSSMCDSLNNIIDTPVLQKCGLFLCSKKYNSEENCSLDSSLFHQQPKKDTEDMSDSVRFLEKGVSGLTLENLDDMKLGERMNKTISEAITTENCINQKVLTFDNGSQSKDSHEQLPLATISIKENGREQVCLSCDDKIRCRKTPEENQKNIYKERLDLPVTESVVLRAPQKLGRKHCKAELLTNPLKERDKCIRKQDVSCVNDKFFDFKQFSSDFSTQLLHGSGGTFSETLPCATGKQAENSYKIDQEFSMGHWGKCSPENYVSSSHDNISWSSVSIINNVGSCSGDTEISSPTILEYPTPPNSAFENTLSPFASSNNDISSQTSGYGSDSLSDLSIAELDVSDDSLYPFALENLASTDVSSEKLSELDVFSSIEKEKINHIRWYLENGGVNSVTAELVKNYSESLDRVSNNTDSLEYNSACFSSEDIPLKGLQTSLTINQHTKQPPVSVKLPSCVIPSQSSACNDNVTQSTVALVPIPLQTRTVPGMKNGRCQREIKPKDALSLENKIDLSKNEKSSSQHVKERTKKNSDHSVMEKIRSSLHREEKNQLLKLSIEQLRSEEESKLHQAVLTGNEKLVYVIVECMRTMIKNENANSRIHTKEKIKNFVNIQNKLGYTPLHYASSKNNDLLTAYLLECGADPFIKDHKNKNTSFHIATERGNDAIILMDLLSCRKNVGNVHNGKGHTILIAAVLNHGKKYNGLKLIEHLLSKNHEVSSQDNEGRTALHIAVQKKDTQLLEVLLTRAVDVERAKIVQDNKGNTILHTAAELTNIEVEVHRKLILKIIQHCSKIKNNKGELSHENITEIRNYKGKLPYQLISEDRKEEIDLLKVKMDDCGFTSL